MFETILGSSKLQGLLQEPLRQDLEPWTGRTSDGDPVRWDVSQFVIPSAGEEQEQVTQNRAPERPLNHESCGVVSVFVAVEIGANCSNEIERKAVKRLVRLVHRHSLTSLG